MTTLGFILLLIMLTALACHRASLTVWAIGWFAALTTVSVLCWLPMVALVLFWVISLVIFVLLLIPAIRKNQLTKPILAIYKNVMPKMSLTEKQAIAAGTVGWVGDLFAGDPDWNKLLKLSPATLTDEEQAFIDGPVTTLCSMLDDWDITHERADLPPNVWQFIKENGFFGMIIPKEFGGKGFSATAHAAVLVKVGSCSISASTTVAVPNSLGPAELLLHYGTDEQKNYYLPKLAKGEEIPCFALTGPEAGSDAGSIPDTGIICKGMFNGKEMIGIKLNFNKRYITLAPVATVVGLAFKLYDPEHLIGDKENLGITCALIPSNTQGVSIGRRHFPLNAAFQNGPIHGKDVFVPMDFIIGGAKMAGQGWKMLVECLSVGRGITLPSMSVAGLQCAALSSGAYSRIRRQFGSAIGYFEGIEEPLARIAKDTYICNSVSKLTTAAIDRGEKPSVLTAIIKYHTTTKARNAACDSMDIHGGKGICLGPNNYLGRGYQSIPISITVEGANILTRSLMIFGQGAIRCHPYVLDEMNAANSKDDTKALNQFDKVFWSHAGFIVSNIFRCLFLGLTGSKFVSAPSGFGKKYFQRLTRYSSILALLADFSMIVIGGNLKRKEKISARLGDVLSMLLLGSSVLKQFNEHGQPKDETILVKAAMEDLLFTAQTQVDGVLKNFPNRYVAAILRALIFPLGRHYQPVSDRLGKRLAGLLINPSEVRSRLCNGIYIGIEGYNHFGRMEEILVQVIATEEIEKRIEKARKKKEIEGYNFALLLQDAKTKGLITEEEAAQVLAAREATLSVINVDDFDPKELSRVGL